MEPRNDDHKTTAVAAVFPGQERQGNRRFLQTCRQLVQSVADTPASKVGGSDRVGAGTVLHAAPKGLKPGPADIWPLDNCVAYAKALRHPQEAEKNIWEMFEAERPRFVSYVGPFDGFHSVRASVSKSCTVRFDNNKYSVVAAAVERPVKVHANAGRIVVRQGAGVVGEQALAFGRRRTVHGPRQDVPFPACKPGAPRNGAPSKPSASFHHGRDPSQAEGQR